MNIMMYLLSSLPGTHRRDGIGLGCKQWSLTPVGDRAGASSARQSIGRHSCFSPNCMFFSDFDELFRGPPTTRSRAVLDVALLAG